MYCFNKFQRTNLLKFYINFIITTSSRIHFGHDTISRFALHSILHFQSRSTFHSTLLHPSQLSRPQAISTSSLHTRKATQPIRFTTSPISTPSHPLHHFSSHQARLQFGPFFRPFFLQLF